MRFSLRVDPSLSDTYPFNRATLPPAPSSDPEPRIRALGLAVLRGPTITLLSPVDGLEEIANPFLAQE